MGGLRLRRVLLDTDIGTDVDDVLALMVLLGVDDVNLEAITVTYGDTALRARMARRMCDLAGRPDVVVTNGRSQPLTPELEVFWLGHEGMGVPGIEEVVLPPGDDAAGTISRLVASAPGELDFVCIGPLANVAEQILAGGLDVRHLWIMGGDFGAVLDEPEHNWKCDPDAAAVVLRSGIPMTLCGIDQTLRVAFGPDQADALARQGQLGNVVAGLMRRWWEVTAPDVEQYAHDAVTVLTMVRPELFRFEDVELSLSPEGFVTATAVPGSPTRIVVDLQPEPVAAAIVEYITRAAR